MATRHAPTTMRRFASSPPRGRGVVLRSFDPAATGARTLFPSRVFDAQEVRRALKTGHQSRKIGAFCTKGFARGWPIYTLTLEERATCPRSCKEWLTCYGNNMQAAERMVADGHLMAQLGDELRQLAADHPAGFIVRLHVLGDFPDVNWLAFWRAMMALYDRLHVFGFTAHDPASEMGRAIALLSADFGWRRWAIRFSGAPHEARASRVIGPGERDQGGIMCPAQTGATDCCGTCALCWQSETSVIFRRH